jgi:hypothetical protein
LNQLVFLIHGIGKNQIGWSDEIIACLTDMANLLPNTAECKGPQVVEALSQVRFVPILYDDFLQDVTRVSLQRKEETIAYFKSAGLAIFSELFTTDTEAESFLRDNLFDVMVYRLFPEHRMAVQNLVLTQIKQGLADAAALPGGLGSFRKSFLAHSLGTIVTHDSLNLLARESGEFSHEVSGPLFDNLFMLANVSALAQNEFNPRESFIRPFLSPNKPGYILNYFDFAHKFDPVAQTFSYRNWMNGVPEDGFDFLSTNHYYAKNIHGYTHYLKSPKVFVPIFSALFGEDLIKKSYARKIIRGEESLPEAESKSAQFVDSLTADLSGMLAEKLDFNAEMFSKACSVILKFLRRVQ